MDNLDYYQDQALEWSSPQNAEMHTRALVYALLVIADRIDALVGVIETKGIKIEGR